MSTKTTEEYEACGERRRAGEEERPTAPDGYVFTTGWTLHALWCGVLESCWLRGGEVLVVPRIHDRTDQWCRLCSHNGQPFTREMVFSSACPKARCQAAPGSLCRARGLKGTLLPYGHFHRERQDAAREAIDREEEIDRLVEAEYVDIEA